MSHLYLRSDTTDEPSYVGTDFPYIKVTGEITWNQVGNTDFLVDTSAFSKSNEDHLLINGKPPNRYKDCPADAYSIPLHQIEMSGSSTWDRDILYALKYDGNLTRRFTRQLLRKPCPTRRQSDC